MGTKNRKSQRSDICNNDVHRASLVKHLRSAKHAEKLKIFPSNFFNETKKAKPKKIYNPKPLKEKATETIKVDDKEPEKEIARKKLNPYHFTNRVLKAGFKINLDSPHNIHINRIVTFTKNNLEIKEIHVNNI